MINNTRNIYVPMVCEESSRENYQPRRNDKRARKDGPAFSYCHALTRDCLLCMIKGNMILHEAFCKAISNTVNTKAYLYDACNSSTRQHPLTNNTFTTCILQRRREVNQIWTPYLLNVKSVKSASALLPPS
jgi:hypothetical protein